MKFEILPSTVENGRAVNRQHLVCMVVDDTVAFDAGSLAMSVSVKQRARVRDVVLSHSHLDHIAGLPMFLDDMFESLDGPLRVHALPSVIRTLENDVFNWRVYPRFSELSNNKGAVLAYFELESGKSFEAAHLSVTPVAVNHGVDSCGFIVSDGTSTIAVSGDTASTDEFWKAVNAIPRLDALIIECAFPDGMNDLAAQSHHLTPSGLRVELGKMESKGVRILVGNIKPMYFDEVRRELEALGLEGLELVEVGRVYEV